MKPKIFVFRVSNGCNEGPFRNRNCHSIRDKIFHDRDKFSDMDLYPGPLTDGIVHRSDKHISALPNACALFYWFGEDLDLLHKKNFLVWRVEVKKFLPGKSGLQVMYHKKRDKVGRMQLVPIKYNTMK